MLPVIKVLVILSYKLYPTENDVPGDFDLVRTLCKSPVQAGHGVTCVKSTHADKLSLGGLSRMSGFMMDLYISITLHILFT